MTERIEADASATRGFFVDMLVRDIGVDGAILDLVDNAVDAAITHAAGDSLSDYSIDLTISPDRFSIVDNCGGIDVEKAQNYVFRFGRPKEFAPQTQIGQFGIGMKRAVFRLGRNFKVDSSTGETKFTVNVDIDQWQEEEGDWTFPMEVDEAPSESPGTTVEVWNLRDQVRAMFSRKNYPERMRREIMERYEQILGRGLEIVLNREPASTIQHELLSGNGISPAKYEENLVSDGHPIVLRIIAGIGHDGQPVSESGWYIYCNGRLVLKADRTELTGWGVGDPEGSGDVTAWHPQYATFRGFVFFISDYPGSLPWTTTKTEIDETSPVYVHALQKMQSIIKQFAVFTNNRRRERVQFEESSGSMNRPIQSSMERASFEGIDDVPLGKFTVPTHEPSSTPPGPKTTSIQFRANVVHVDELKDALDLSTNRQVGERAFKRLYDQEIREE